MNPPWYLLGRRNQVGSPTSKWWDLDKSCILVKSLCHYSQGSQNFLTSTFGMHGSCEMDPGKTKCRGWSSTLNTTPVLCFAVFYPLPLDKRFIYLFFKIKCLHFKNEMFKIITHKLWYPYYLFLVLIAAHTKPLSSTRLASSTSFFHEAATPGMRAVGSS